MSGLGVWRITGGFSVDYFGFLRSLGVVEDSRGILEGLSRM